jgi:hypothetical protein
MIHPAAHAALVRVRIDDARRPRRPLGLRALGAAVRHPRVPLGLRALAAWRRHPRPAVAPLAVPDAETVLDVRIRWAFADDAHALLRLAVSDGAEVPAAPVLVAEAGGQLRAALSLRDGRAVADPFHPTAALVELLRLRAAQLRAADGGRAAWGSAPGWRPALLPHEPSPPR